MRYLLAAIEKIPDFRPNHLQPAEVVSLLNTALEVRNEDFLACQNELQCARERLGQQALEAKKAITGVYANMRERYSNDQNTLEALRRLKIEETPCGDPREGMREMSNLWAKLPVPAGSPLGAMAYVPWQGMNRAVFDSLRRALEDAGSPLPRLEQQLQSAGERLQIQKTLLTRFVQAALQQAQGRFLPGSWQQSLIEAIPLRAPEQLPGKARITISEFTPLHSAVLLLEAPHATSFTLRHRQPHGFTFAVRASGIISKIYTTGYLPPGDHEFELIGHNALGAGEPGRPVRLSL